MQHDHALSGKKLSFDNIRHKGKLFAWTVSVLFSLIGYFLEIVNFWAPGHTHPCGKGGGGRKGVGDW